MQTKEAIEKVLDALNDDPKVVEGMETDVEGTLRTLVGNDVSEQDFSNLTKGTSKLFSDKAIVLNLPETPDRLYSGKIYATGSVDIDGDRFGCRIDAAARTDAGSTVAIMTKSPSSASSSDFIHFVNHTPDPSTMHGSADRPSLRGKNH